MNNLFRRALITRLVPAEVAQKLALRHTRGIILYGPPGTGKTLIARNLAKLLSSQKPKIVAGPEIVTSLAGSTESNIRDLFKTAEKQAETMGANSPLNVIVFDEIDALLRKRSMNGNEASNRTSNAAYLAARDSYVNQFLAKLDGLKEHNNVLVIGTTNRLDLLDPAVLRQGRLEIQISLPLPDADGRTEILRIHSRKLLESGALTKETDATLYDIAQNHCQNLNGSEIESVVNSATSLALERYLKEEHEYLSHDRQACLSDEITFETMLESLEVKHEDFVEAASEVRKTTSAPGSLVKFDSRVAVNTAALGVFNSTLNSIDPSFSTSSICVTGMYRSRRTQLVLEALSGAESPFEIQRVVDAAEFHATNDDMAREFMFSLFEETSRYKHPIAILFRDIDLLPPSIRSMLSAEIRKFRSGQRLLVVATTLPDDEICRGFDDTVTMNPNRDCNNYVL